MNRLLVIWFHTASLTYNHSSCRFYFDFWILLILLFSLFPDPRCFNLDPIDSSNSNVEIFENISIFIDIRYVNLLIRSTNVDTSLLLFNIQASMNFITVNQALNSLDYCLFKIKIICSNIYWWTINNDFTNYFTFREELFSFFNILFISSKISNRSNLFFSSLLTLLPFINN